MKNLSTQKLQNLRCPITQETLDIKNNKLVSTVSGNAYQLFNNEIPLFAKEFISTDAEIQQKHFDKVWERYAINLTYPHTEEYNNYLDNQLKSIVSKIPMKNIAEICCGQGEALAMFSEIYQLGYGVDISTKMLELASTRLDQNKTCLLQGDATSIPLKDGCVDTVFMLGGIHHVNNREKLFKEISRILIPGGTFIWREPVSDFLLWRSIRNVIYRLSPALDFDTESPLRYMETKPFLDKAGLELTCWQTYGFIGFCLFMNSDILIFNRVFQYVPGIRKITRAFIKLDSLLSRQKLLSSKGLQVIGCAKKIST